MATKKKPTPKKSSKNTKKAAASLPAEAAAKKPRRLKPPRYRSFKLHKTIKHPETLPNSFGITKKAAIVLWQNKLLFAGIIIIYGILNLILVRGFSAGTDVSSLKDSLQQVFGGHFSQLATSFTVLMLMVSSSGNSNGGVAGAYQTFLVLITSLAIIWSLRQVLTGAKIRVRDSFYQGIYPLVPFILVFLVVCLQLLPFLIGATLYSLVITSGIAAYVIEKVLWAMLFFLLALLSLYMLASSLFALYIVTLPQMTPMKALRSARELVRYRRWTVLRKILFLPLLLFVIAAVVMIPIIILVAPLAQWIFFVLSMFSVVAIHAYMYTLYRELL